MDACIAILRSGDTQSLLPALRDFVEKSSQCFDFPALNQNDREVLWTGMYNLLVNPQEKKIHKECLSAIRILSRDKINLNEIITGEWLNILLHHSGLTEEKNFNKETDYEIALEALKCLCNIIFNSKVARAISSKNDTSGIIIKRLRTYRAGSVPIEVIYFDMKMLFILTALCGELRPKLRNELHGLTYLTEMLDSILKELRQDNEGKGGMDDQKLSDNQVNLSCEILKVLFNLSVSPSLHDFSDEEGNDESTSSSQYFRLVTILREFLLTQVQSVDKKLELYNHIVNLLTNMPDECLRALISIVQNEHLESQRQYEGHNMSALYEVVEFLKSRLGSDPTVKVQHEMLSPVLSVIVKCVRNNRIMRKYLRNLILPPLRDVRTRPEEGNTLRNCLCRLLTTPITQVRDLSADFLFVLCKENVGRMIKYTGYGNAAGMFANRGLLGGKNGDTSNYSSDSEDSETEEYAECKHGINPVVGCYQPPRPNPTAHMTEEQKEYEAMKLVGDIDNLMRQGVVKPCKIGRDGRPQPIEHILQLQEGLEKQHT